MPNDFSGSETAADYKAVCQNPSCGHEIDLPQGQPYYRGKCPVCGDSVSVEIDQHAKAASLPYVHLCLKCGYEKRASYNIDIPSFCPRCNDAMVVVGYVLD